MFKFDFSFGVEMEIDMLESILGTRSMGLVSITLLMVTLMRARGMRVVSKDSACIHSAMVRRDAVNGMQAASKPIYLLSPMQSFEQFR